MQPGGDAQAAGAPRDERTLDLFGDPVLEAGEGASAVARGRVAEVAAVVDAASNAQDHQQATLDGFDAPEVAVPAAAGGEVVADGATAEAGDVPAAADAASGAAFEPTEKDMPAGAERAPAAEATLEVASDAMAQDASAHTADAASAAQDSGAPSRAEGIATAGAAAAVATKDDDGAATKPAPPRAAGARSSTGTKRRTSAAAAREATAPPAPGAADEAPEPGKADMPPRMTASAVSVEPSVTAPERDDVAASAARPAASAATFVTKPSSDHAGASFDADTQLRPLSDRLAVLQAEATALRRAADREMRRVNRLLLALAVVVLAGLVALVMQTMQVSRLKLGAIAQQQRIDRLTADLATQQATVTTLEQHNDALLSQVDRLERNVSRQTAAGKRVRRGR
ncbi:flagellar hook-length control protein FliK [Burkholderia ubonensis]|uniref:flagellar hook-length control protein FliK n=1 Tax=Burkholderia ubonensis TaxID=101571 RepID=UPI000A67F2D7|nr:flagellar hook-length control protein FliK [Burkholderia ubonensis]